MSSAKRFALIFSLLILLTAIGSTGFHFIQGKPWIESTYLAIITLTTVGARDPAQTNAEMIFVMVYLTFGLGIFTYSLFSLGQSLFDAQFHHFLKKRKMQKKIAALKDHHIICGLGRMGETICKFLSSRNRPFVIVDTNEEVLESLCEEKGWLFIHGDATDDQSLMEAGIENARAMATVLHSDSDNVLVTLSAHMINPQMQIVARASNDNAVVKLERAGAARVISPYSSGAIKMARFMMNPALENFMEIADGDDDTEWELAELVITDECQFVNQALSETNLRDLGVMIIGIRRESGERLMPPSGAAILQKGDVLFAFGNLESVNTMIGLVEGASKKRK